ncbi:MAG: glycoside hydrolase family 108 protein [Caulobacteraceae bacterium]
MVYPTPYRRIPPYPGDSSLSCLPTLAREGGYADHPSDRGGPTNFGITAATLGAWRKLGRAATAEEVRALTRPEARDIYRQMFIRDPAFDGVEDEALRAILIDTGVLHGPGRAARWLQEALGVTVDGDVGAQTLSALKRTDAGAIARAVLGKRIRRIGETVRRDPRQAVFAAGWLNRAADLLALI